MLEEVIRSSLEDETYNLLHQNRDERACWRQHGIDALILAARLWAQTIQGAQ
jgi:hypothetical protein